MDPKKTLYDELRIEFNEAIERMKAIESAWTKSYEENQRLNEELNHRVLKAKEAQNHSLEYESKTKKESEVAERNREMAEASSKARAEVLEHMLVDEKKLKVEGDSVERQRKDLGDAQREISRREKFLLVDEDRLQKLRRRLEKLIEAKQLEAELNREELESVKPGELVGKI